AERLARGSAELVPGQGWYRDQIVGRKTSYLAPDQAVPAAAKDEDIVGVLVPFERREAAGRNLEITQLALLRRVGEQHLPGHRFEQRPVVLLVGQHLHALPAVVLRLAMNRSLAHALSVGVRLDGVDEGRGLCGELLARGEQAAADQQHDIG